VFGFFGTSSFQSQLLWSFANSTIAALPDHAGAENGRQAADNPFD
jgi:hypothetical protein